MALNAKHDDQTKHPLELSDVYRDALSFITMVLGSLAIGIIAGDVYGDLTKIEVYVRVCASVFVYVLGGITLVKAVQTGNLPALILVLMMFAMDMAHVLGFITPPIIDFAYDIGSVLIMYLLYLMVVVEEETRCKQARGCCRNKEKPHG